MGEMVPLSSIQPLILERLELTDLRFMLERFEKFKIAIRPVPIFAPLPETINEEDREFRRDAEAILNSMGSIKDTFIWRSRNMLHQLLSDQINEIDRKLRQFGIGNPEAPNYNEPVEPKAAKRLDVRMTPGD